MVKKPDSKDAADVVVDVAVNVVEEDSNRSVTGRPNDNKIKEYAVPNSTFASRAKAGKRVGSASNKAITADESRAK